MPRSFESFVDCTADFTPQLRFLRLGIDLVRFKPPSAYCKVDNRNLWQSDTTASAFVRLLILGVQYDETGVASLRPSIQPLYPTITPCSLLDDAPPV